jgi:hypothetical protein
MKILAYVIVATIFEAVGDAVMRIAIQSPCALAGRVGLFALASLLLTLYGLCFFIGMSSSPLECFFSHSCWTNSTRSRH